jgi:hypothetical protein
MTDLSQIEKKLCSFSNDAASYIKEFKYLTQAYDMTWHDIYVILSFILNLDEKERVWLVAQVHADDVHCTDLTLPVGSPAVPREDPHWGYQDPSMLAAQNYMLTCLLVGLQSASHRAVNFDKLREVIQHPTENPADFLGCLTETLTHYTKLDPSSRAGMLILNSHFISQSSLDIQKKLKQAEDGPQSPQGDLVKMAFKVFSENQLPLFASTR